MEHLARLSTVRGAVPTGVGIAVRQGWGRRVREEVAREAPAERQLIASAAWLKFDRQGGLI